MWLGWLQYLEILPLVALWEAARHQCATRPQAVCNTSPMPTHLNIWQYCYLLKYKMVKIGTCRITITTTSTLTSITNKQTNCCIMKRGLPRRWGITDRIKCIGGLPLTPPSSCCGWSHPESIELKADMPYLLSGCYRDHILVGALVEAHLILGKNGFGETEGKAKKHL